MNQKIFLFSLLLVIFNVSYGKLRRQHNNGKLIQPIRPSNYDTIIHRFLQEEAEKTETNTTNTTSTTNSTETDDGSKIDDMKEAVTDNFEDVKDNIEDMIKTNPKDWSTGQKIGLGV